MDISWVTLFLFSIVGIKWNYDTNAFLDAFHAIDHKFYKIDNHIEYVNKNAIKKEEIEELKSSITNANLKINNYLFENQQEHWEHIKTMYDYDSMGARYLDRLKFNFNRKEIIVYGYEVELVNNLELEKHIKSIFGKDIPIEFIDYIERKVTSE
jgi:hypothetical protein